MHTKVPRRLTSRMRSHSSSGMSATAKALFSTPALLKAKLRRPKASTVRATAASTCSGTEISHGIERTSPPAAFTCAAVFFSASSVRSRIATRAPSAANAMAAARPMPLAAPVTKATLSVKRSGLGTSISPSSWNGITPPRAFGEELVEGDRIIAHTDPGSVVDRVRDGGADAANAELGDALCLHGRGHRIGLVEEDDLLVRDVGVNWHFVSGKVVVDEEAA